MLFGYHIRRQEVTYRCYPCCGGFGVPIHVTVELDVVSHEASDGRRLGYKRGAFQREKGNSSQRERKTDKTERGHTSKEQEKSSSRAKPLFAYSDGDLQIGPLACKVEEISINKIRKKTFIFVCQKYDRQRK